MKNLIDPINNAITSESLYPYLMTFFPKPMGANLSSDAITQQKKE